jgi:hypothetical protein
MHKGIRSAVAAAAFAAFTFAAAGTASADHCVSPEGDSPGFSYFGQDGRFDGGDESNARVCRERTGSPSERAPGR